MLRLSALLVLLAAALSASAQNLLGDPGFEQWGNDGVPTEWTPGGNEPGTVSIPSATGVTNDPALVASGSWAGYVSSIGPFSDAERLSTLAYAPTTTGYYTLSFDVRLRDNVLSPDHRLEVWFGGLVASLTDRELGDTYQTFTYEVTGDPTGLLGLDFVAYNEDDYYLLDNVSLVSHAAPSAAPGPLAALPFGLMALRRRRARPARL